ncbi:MAG: hypothetical protein ACJASR_001043 [Psychroserpens sp.]|jgi:hypothetical protein
MNTAENCNFRLVEPTEPLIGTYHAIFFCRKYKIKGDRFDSVILTDGVFSYLIDLATPLRRKINELNRFVKIDSMFMQIEDKRKLVIVDISEPNLEDVLARFTYKLDPDHEVQHLFSFAYLQNMQTPMFKEIGDLIFNARDDDWDYEEYEYAPFTIADYNRFVECHHIIETIVKVKEADQFEKEVLIIGAFIFCLYKAYNSYQTLHKKCSERDRHLITMLEHKIARIGYDDAKLCGRLKAFAAIASDNPFILDSYSTEAQFVHYLNLFNHGSRRQKQALSGQHDF